MEIIKFSESVMKLAYDLNENDVFEHPTLGLMQFNRLKRGGKSMEASTAQGQRYNLRFPFSKEWKVIGMAKVEKIQTDVDKLTAGCLFAAFEERKKTATLYKFVEFGRTGKIKCVNPFDETMKWTVDQSFTIRLVENF